MKRIKKKKPAEDKQLKMVLEIVRVCIDEYAPWYRDVAKKLAIEMYNKQFKK